MGLDRHMTQRVHTLDKLPTYKPERPIHVPDVVANQHVLMKHNAGNMTHEDFSKDIMKKVHELRIVQADRRDIDKSRVFNKRMQQYHLEPNSNGRDLKFDKHGNIKFDTK